MKRIRAAWRAFLKPERSAEVGIVGDADAIVRMLRQYQRRRGLPPTI